MRTGLTSPIVAAVIAVTLLGSPVAAGSSWCGRPALDAQPRCKTGCPCGNACISCAKTCRIGAGSATRAPTTTPRTEPISSARTVLGTAASGDTATYTGRWFGSSANQFYFRAGCPIAGLLAAGDLVPLPDSIAAEGVRFRRLLMPKC